MSFVFNHWGYGERGTDYVTHTPYSVIHTPSPVS